MMKKDNMVDRKSNVNNNDLNYHLIITNLDYIIMTPLI